MRQFVRLQCFQIIPYLSTCKMVNIFKRKNNLSGNASNAMTLRMSSVRFLTKGAPIFEKFFYRLLIIFRFVWDRDAKNYDFRTRVKTYKRFRNKPSFAQNRFPNAMIFRNIRISDNRTGTIRYSITSYRFTRSEVQCTTSLTFAFVPRVLIVYSNLIFYKYVELLTTFLWKNSKLFTYLSCQLFRFLNVHNGVHEYFYFQL